MDTLADSANMHCAQLLSMYFANMNGSNLSKIYSTNPVNRGLYFGPKTMFIPPPLKMIFFPLLSTRRFATPIVVFLPYILPILHLFYPFTSPFLIFFALSFFFFPLSSFFFHIFPFFLFAFSYFFPQMTSADISPPLGEGVFSKI